MANNEIMVNQVSIENKQLARYTEQLFKIGLNVRNSYLKVASIIYQIDEKGLVVEQFGNLSEYGEKVLGLKKAQTYALKSVGERFVDPKTKKSILHHDDKDFSVSQLQALLPVKEDEVIYDWSEKEIITPDMSVKEIKQVVKDYKNPETESENNEEVKESEEIVVEAETNDNETPIFTVEVVNYDGRYVFMVKENGADFYQNVEFDAVVKMLQEFAS